MPAPIDHRRGKTRAVVLHVAETAFTKKSDNQREPEAQLTEAVGLALALELDIVLSDIVKLAKASPRTLIGSGKVETLADTIASAGAELVIVNGELTPTQQRNLEVAWQRKVIDRTGLILEIFADRARTHAGRLQVELAALTYQQSRLVRTWTHLERQRGGMGKTGGPGETQIELDRRMIRDRIAKIRDELRDVENTRALHRKARTKAGLPVVALVGYTNAGKSTLFNALVNDDDAFTQDMLFATLDPLMRKLRLPSGREIILSDTVGFISDLPHELVEAFHGTLEEVALADVLLHVHDGSSTDAPMQDRDVKTVLTTLGAENIPTLDVCNKVDLLPDGMPPYIDGLPVSGLKGQGLEALLAALEQTLGARESDFTFLVPAADGRKIAWLHAHGEVLKMELVGDDYRITARLLPEDAEIFTRMYGR